MLQDAVVTEKGYKTFIENVVKTGTVWGLKNEEGWATSLSNDFEDAEVIAFWSDETLAKVCVAEEWEAYTPHSITLVAFLENWMPGMYKDDILVGTNWDHNMFGKEVEPLELALAIVFQLQAEGVNINLTNFDSIHDYETQVRALLDEA